MVNARLCETARQVVFFASPRHFINFLDCETETSKCFECEREAFRLLKLEPQNWIANLEPLALRKIETPRPYKKTRLRDTHNR